MVTAEAVARRHDLGIDTSNWVDSDLITLAEASRLIRGRKGDHLNIQVVQRYANPKRGRVFLVGDDRVRLVLPTIGMAHGKRTTRAWVEAWKRAFAELSAAAIEPPEPVNPRTPRQERRDHERAVEKLKRAGFKSAR